MTYEIAKRAIELFESKYVRQSKSGLWEWAVNLATEEAAERATTSASKPRINTRGTVVYIRDALRPKQCFEGGDPKTCECPDHGRTLT